MSKELRPILQLFKDALERVLANKEKEHAWSLEVQLGDESIKAATIPPPRAYSRSSRRPQYKHPAGDPKPDVINGRSVKTYLERTKLKGVSDLEYEENAQGVLVKVKRGVFLGDAWRPINEAIRGGLGGQWHRGQGWVIPK